MIDGVSGAQRGFGGAGAGAGAVPAGGPCSPSWLPLRSYGRLRPSLLVAARRSVAPRPVCAVPYTCGSGTANAAMVPAHPTPTPTPDTPPPLCVTARSKSTGLTRWRLRR